VAALLPIGDQPTIMQPYEQTRIVGSRVSEFNHVAGPYLLVRGDAPFGQLTFVLSKAH
jgi:hypothetical protein